MNRVGKTITALALCSVFAALVWALAGWSLPFAGQDSMASTDETANQPTALVEKGTVETKVTGPGEIKGSWSGKLSVDKNRWFKDSPVTLNQRIAKGTTLVNYTYGKPLVAPYDLVVTSKNLPSKTNQPLSDDHYLEVTRVDSLNVDVAVNESDILKVHEGQEVDVTVGSSEETPIKGSVASINQIGAYNTSGSKYTVTVSIPNEDGNIFVGMSANLSIKASQVSDVLTVPVSAISTDGEKPMVSVIGDDGSVEHKEVSIGLSDGQKTEISGDIHEGDRVILKIASPSGGMSIPSNENHEPSK